MNAIPIFVRNTFMMTVTEKCADYSIHQADLSACRLYSSREVKYISRMVTSQPYSHATILYISILIFFSSCHIASNSCSYHLFIRSPQKWKVMTDYCYFYNYLEMMRGVGFEPTNPLGTGMYELAK